MHQQNCINKEKTRRRLWDKIKHETIFNFCIAEVWKELWRKQQRREIAERQKLRFVIIRFYISDETMTTFRQLSATFNLLSQLAKEWMTGSFASCLTIVTKSLNLILNLFSALFSVGRKLKKICSVEWQ